MRSRSLLVGVRGSLGGSKGLFGMRKGEDVVGCRDKACEVFPNVSLFDKWNPTCLTSKEFENF